MDMKGEAHIPAPKSVVWDALNDPEVLKASIAGCEELLQEGDDSFTAKVRAKVGPVSARFAGKVRLTDIDPPNGYRIEGEGAGGAAGFAKGGATVSLAEDGSGGTLLTYDANANVGGKLAQIGARLIDGAARKMADDFFTRFSEIAAARAADAPPSDAVASDEPEAPPQTPEIEPEPLATPSRPVPDLAVSASMPQPRTASATYVTRAPLPAAPVPAPAAVTFTPPAPPHVSVETQTDVTVTSGPPTLPEPALAASADAAPQVVSETRTETTTVTRENVARIEQAPERPAVPPGPIVAPTVTRIERVDDRDDVVFEPRGSANSGGVTTLMWLFGGTFAVAVALYVLF